MTLDISNSNLTLLTSREKVSIFMTPVCLICGTFTLNFNELNQKEKISWAKGNRDKQIDIRINVFAELKMHVNKIWILGFEQWLIIRFSKTRILKLEKEKIESGEVCGFGIQQRRKNNQRNYRNTENNQRESDHLPKKDSRFEYLDILMIFFRMHFV